MTDDPASVVINAQTHQVALEDEETVLEIQVLQEMDDEDLDEDQKARLRSWQAYVWLI